MPTRYPRGVSSYGVPLIGSEDSAPNSSHFFVDSGHAQASNGNDGEDPNTPMASIDAAVARCAANNGDVIHVLPGHVETITGANGLDLDVAGIKVKGYGYGLARPQINLTTAVAASMRLNAASVIVENIRVTGGVDAITNAIVINGVTDCILRGIELRDVTGQVAIGLACSDGTDRLIIDGYRHIGDSAAGTTRAMQFDGCDDLILRNFYIYGNFSTTPINFVTTLSARVWIHSGYTWTENAADTGVVDTITGSTGTIGPDVFIVLQDNAANITEAVTGATFQIMDPVYVVNAVNEKALLIDWTASTDAIV